jgi:hypothetical protein
VTIIVTISDGDDVGRSYNERKSKNDVTFFPNTE